MRSHPVLSYIYIYIYDSGIFLKSGGAIAPSLNVAPSLHKSEVKLHI